MADEVKLDKVEEQAAKELQEKIEVAQKLLAEKIKETAKDINDVLTKAGLEFQITHKIVINPDLKQEEIFHDIILRPMRKNG